MKNRTELKAPLFSCWLRYLSSLKKLFNNHCKHCYHRDRHIQNAPLASSAGICRHGKLPCRQDCCATFGKWFNPIKPRGGGLNQPPPIGFLSVDFYQVHLQH